MRGLHISVSQVKQYLRCPRQYELSRVRGVEPAFVPVPLVFGTAFHAALAYFYSLLKETSTPPPLVDLVQVFRDAWAKGTSGPVPLQGEEDDSDVDHDAKGAAMLAAFHAHAVESPPCAVVEVERFFSVALHDPDTGEVLEEELVGAWDLLIREGDRNVVVEHKSAARKYAADQLRFDQQPTAYKLAARHLGLGEVGLRFQVVSKTKVPAVQVVDLERNSCAEDDFLRTTVGVLRAIDAGAFYPVRGWQCRGCPYAHACPGAPP